MYRAETFGFEILTTGDKDLAILAAIDCAMQGTDAAVVDLKTGLTIHKVEGPQI